MSVNEPQDRYSSWAVGWISFAGVIMIMVGAFEIIAGIVGIAKDDILVGVRDYTFKFDAAQWGWIHLVLGIIVLIAGFGLFSGNILARSVAVLIAALSALANFLWMPYYPLWSIVMISLDIAVIWAVTAHGHDVVRGPGY